MVGPDFGILRGSHIKPANTAYRTETSRNFLRGAANIVPVSSSRGWRKAVPRSRRKETDLRPIYAYRPPLPDPLRYSKLDTDKGSIVSKIGRNVDESALRNATRPLTMAVE
ncbi:hypothetical protein KM043_002775 [Ampulex compressa]|nr:hypothetical protein KM043_002775 [Ampulex compressa]